MSYGERYHFADFTRGNYRRLLMLARQVYRPRTFVDFDPSERFVLWRHDIDYSPHAAVKLARIEAELDFVATYFVHLHNSFYNALEPAVASHLREITALGHQIGLHFDSHFYGIDSVKQLEKWLVIERDIVEQTLEVPVSVFSFHISTPFTMARRDWTYAGMIHVHAAYFQDQVGYCSDSNGVWRHRRLEDVLRAATDDRLQVLTHPAWWQAEPMSPRARIWRCAAGRAVATMKGYDDLLASLGRENVEGDPTELPAIRPPATGERGSSGASPGAHTSRA